MGYVRINANSISQKVLKTTKVRKVAEQKVENIIEKEKSSLIKAFNNHPVTQEIEAGPKASNISGTLGGYGNLFSFLGFYAGTNPVEPVRDLLYTIRRKTLKIVKGKYYATVQYPSKEEINASSPMTFESARSWVDGIENGISGFSQYIYTRYLAGKSKEGVQSDKMNRGGRYQKRNYLFSMLSIFVKNIRGGKNDYSV